MYNNTEPTAFAAQFPLEGSGYTSCPIGGEKDKETHEMMCYATGNHFEDAIDAFVQLGRSGALVGYTLGTVFSIAFFNFSGVSITKYMNAATRMVRFCFVLFCLSFTILHFSLVVAQVLDSLRTIVIWAFSLGVKWQTFCFMDVVGFCVLLLGTVIFNKLLKIPCYTDPDDEAEKRKKKSGTTEPLLDVDVDEEAFMGESPALPVMDQLLTPSMQKPTAARKN